MSETRGRKFEIESCMLLMEEIICPELISEKKKWKFLHEIAWNKKHFVEKREYSYSNNANIRILRQCER